MTKLPITTALYGLIVKIRTFAFNKQWLKSTRFDIPVICVGNIAVGGTGKTPHISHLIHIYNSIAPEKHIAVLSRGYKRKTKGFVIANESSNVQTIGDEPMMIHMLHPNITVAVDEKRVHGIEQLLAIKKPDIILLDDAFQHRYVQPSTSIVLVDYNHPPFNDTLLPSGRLREPMQALKRADIIIVTKAPTNLPTNTYNYWRDKLGLSTANKQGQPNTSDNSKNNTSANEVNKQTPNNNRAKVQRLYFSSIEYPNNIDFRAARAHKALLVTGIANPKPLAEYIHSQGIDFKQLTFADHHNFSKSDIKRIENALNTIDNQAILLTTEKDATRLIPLLSNDTKARCLVIPIDITIQNIGEDIDFDKLIMTLSEKLS